MKNLVIQCLLIISGSVLCQCTSSTFQIDADFPGGNIVVIDIRGDSVLLQQDFRDTEGYWFYWSFRIRGAAGRSLNFQFTNEFYQGEIDYWYDAGVIDLRGPAISIDGGLSWRWLGEQDCSKTTFQYTFGPKENEVIFGMGMNYTEKDFQRFFDKIKNHPDIKIETLCASGKGRDIELIRILDKDSKPDFKIFMSARHHCGEMMASYVLEGIIETVLSDKEEGRRLRNLGDFFIVPFVDKDGVEDGDQGKNRHPHDHNRDYVQRIYPEIRAITEQVPEWSDGKPLFFLDMHCPSIREDEIYFTDSRPAPDSINYNRLREETVRLGAFLETVNRETVHKGTVNKSVVPYNVSSNKLSQNPGSNIMLQTSKLWASKLPNAIFSSTIEIPFSSAFGITVDANSARQFGHDLANAIRIYLENH